MDSEKIKMQDNQRLRWEWYIKIFLRRKWFFFIPLVVVYLGFVISSFLLPKIYEAKAIILIEEKKVVNPLLRNLLVSTSVQSRLNALKEEILAWPRLYQLVEKLGLNKNIKTPLQLEELINRIRRNIFLKMKSREVLIISYQGRDPYQTQKLVNTLCDILIQRNISAQTEDTESAINFIEKQLAIYKKKLDKAEAALRQFKEVYGLGTLPGLNYTSPAGVALTQINKQLAELEAKLVLASIDCTENHPRIKEIKKRIQSLKQKRVQYIRMVAERANLDPTTYIQIADSLPRQQEELARLTRDKQVNEKIYAMLLEKLESAKITEQLDKSAEKTKFIIIEPARLPLRPIKPNKLKFNLLGILLGSLIGCGLIYLAEYTDNSFKSAEELKNCFGYPVLGTISKIITEEDLKKRAWVIKRLVVLTLMISFILILFFLFLPELKKIDLNNIEETISFVKEKINFWWQTIVYIFKN